MFFFTGKYDFGDCWAASLLLRLVQKSFYFWGVSCWLWIFWPTRPPCSGNVMFRYTTSHLPPCDPEIPWNVTIPEEDEPRSPYMPLLHLKMVRTSFIKITKLLLKHEEDDANPSSKNSQTNPMSYFWQRYYSARLSLGHWSRRHLLRRESSIQLRREAWSFRQLLWCPIDHVGDDGGAEGGVDVGVDDVPDGGVDDVLRSAR